MSICERSSASHSVLTAGAVPRDVSLEQPHVRPGTRERKSLCGSGSQIPASRCLWLGLALPPFRYHRGTRSKSGAANVPVCNAERCGCRALSLAGEWMAGEVHRGHASLAGGCMGWL